MRVAISGASGMVGQALSERLRARGDEVRSLVRRAAKSDAEIRWDPTGGEVDSLAGLDAVVHLAGASVAERWTDSHKKRIRESRELGTRALAQAIARDGVPRLVSASAVGFYGDRGDEVLEERAPAGEGFLAEVCEIWEREAHQAEGATVACVRIGIVLDGDDGALPKMAMPFKFGVGGRVGSGEQWVSWIHLDDLVSIFVALLDRADVTGAVNAVAPNPARQKDLADAIAKTLRRPAWLPVPKAAMRLVMGSEMADEMLLVSQRVRPARVEQELGIDWRFAELRPALEDCLR